jgi:putative ABC transport system permease protein
VISGARITVRACLNNYGLGAGFGRNRLDRLVGRVRGLPRTLALSLRNSLRRKARMMLTLFTLVLGGVMFIVVMSLGSSVSNTIEVLLDIYGYDVSVGFDRLYRKGPLIEVAESVPGVTRAEVWGRGGAQLSLVTGPERQPQQSPDQRASPEHSRRASSEGRGVGLWGVPPDSEMFHPRIVSGRALLPGDDRAILLNSKIATDENIQVGDEVALTIGEQESVWTVVGLILNIDNEQNNSFVPFDALARATGSVNRGHIVMVMSEEDNPTTQQKLTEDLRDAYTARRMEPSGLVSANKERQQRQAEFNLITVLMLAMAALAAVVGSVGLMSTMTINVVERRREIGVMRAIGATSAAILRVFVVEGVLVGVLSWLLAAPLSYPGARILSNAVGAAWMKISLDFSYSMGGLVLWLAIVAVLSALASLWPALRATRVSVREALAYE